VDHGIVIGQATLSWTKNRARRADTGRLRRAALAARQGCVSCAMVARTLSWWTSRAAAMVIL
jgi:hypothetical protein